MNEIYRNNLNLLEKINPGLKEKIVKSHTKNGLKFIDKPFPNIIVGKKSIHSMINPIAEANKLIDNINIDKIGGTIFLFLGMGIGYHIRIFIEKYGDQLNKNQVIVIEKNLKIFKLITENLDISFLNKVTIFVSEKLDELEGYFNRIDPIKFGGYRIIKLKGAIIDSPEYYLSIERIFKDIIGSKLSDILTRLSFEILWTRNIIENVPNLLYSSPINSLKGIGENGTSLIIGAGPSLYSQMKIIKELSKKAYIISVDTAIPALLSCKIKPDIIVTLDGQFQSLFDFSYLFNNKTIDLEKPILVYDLLAYPKIIRRFRYNSFFTSSLNILKNQNGNILFVDNPFINYIKDSFLPFDSLPCGGSVLTTALELALYMNFTKIILVGADLSYTQYKTHVNSSPSYNAFFNLSNRLSTIGTKNIQSISKRETFILPGIKSKKVHTDYVLTSYKRWIENQDRYKGKIINSTSDGLHISNLRYIELKDVAESLPKTTKLRINKMLKPVSKEALANILTKLGGDIDYLIDIIKDRKFNYEHVLKTLPYFSNILIESKKILKDETKIEGYFYNIASFFKKIIKKSTLRLDK